MKMQITDSITSFHYLIMVWLGMTKHVNGKTPIHVLIYYLQNYQMECFRPLDDNQVNNATLSAARISSCKQLELLRGKQKPLFIWIVLSCCCSVSACQQHCQVPIWELSKSALLPLLNLVPHVTKEKCSINQVADAERGGGSEADK